MIKIEASTLEEAFDKASKELNCSITDLETIVVQQPSNGFLGFFKKNAIITATCKVDNTQVKVVEQKVEKKEHKPKTEELVKQDKKTPQEKKKETPKKEEKTKKETLNKESEIKNNNQKEQKPKEKKIKKVAIKKVDKPEIEQPVKDKPKTSYNSGQNIMDNFYANTSNDSKENILDNIKLELTRLFSFSCYKIEITKVEFFDENTIYIEFDGEDSALLIGKDGYRYKALSYMIFNWINSRYNYMIRLEVSSFLKNQEEMIDKYLEPIIARVEKEGNAKTKPLNGILVYIALSKLRDKFPNKYVSVKDGFDDSKYIIINEFLNNKRK
jgi:spoIIIJ-associated protein